LWVGGVVVVVVMVVVVVGVCECQGG